MNNVIQHIIDSTNYWGGWGHQNSQLELAVYAIELKNAGLDYTKLKPLYDKMIAATRVKPGIFIRSPKNPDEKAIANSHDNWVGLAILSYLFDNGAVAKEILDKGVKFGFWITGQNEKGNFLDSEWFTPMRPEYRSIMKLAAGRKLTWLEKLGIEINMLTATAWNMKRTRYLFLKDIGYKDSKPKLITRLLGKIFKKHLYFKEIKPNVGFIKQSVENIGDMFKGRYGDDVALKYLWSLTNN